MERDLKNKIVVVTGGAQGIGYAITEKFLANSAYVIILDLNDKGNEAAKTLAAKYGEDRVTFIKCDVTKDLDDVTNKIFATHKKVDVLVNNAGIVNEFDLRATIEVNIIAVIEWSLKFQDHMRLDKGGKGGTIINIASIYGYIGDPFVPFYKASKHAVVGFTKTLGHEENFKKTGVRIVAICPSFTYTNLVEFGGVPEEEMKYFKEYNSVKPWQHPEAVADAAEEVFRIADSGTLWSVIGGKTENVPYVKN